MSTTRILTVGMAAMLVAGSAALAAEPAPDPRTTVLPIYTLPESTAADGKLDEWAGIPPSATAEQFRFSRGTKAITPSPGFAPALFCGMKKGSQDLYLLVVVRDDRRCTLDRDTWWAMDSLEIYLDFGRENRDRQMPDWQNLDVSKNKLDTANIREMGQFGAIPKTLLSQSRILPAMHAGEWKVDYASALVEGGVAYEIRLDMKSVLTDLKLDRAPGCIGFDLGFADFDYAMPISTEGWMNRDGLYRLFGDDMNHAWPKGYGMLSLVPVAPPAKVANTELPRTLLARFGEITSADDVARDIAKLPPTELADLVYWAGVQGAVLTPDVVLQLMGVDSAQVQDFFDAAVKTHGKIDIVVCNAGIGGREQNKTAEHTHEDWHNVIAVNQTGVFYTMQAALKHMTEQGYGSIFNVASLAGLKPSVYNLSYSASKFAVVGMTKSAALEYGRDNIRINAVCPGYTRTPLLEKLLGFRPEMEETLKRLIPMNRFGEVDEIAEAIAWLASDQSKFITGQTLVLDGGTSLI